MIRPFTCICMFLAAGSGLYLYQTKHRAQLLDRTIAQTYKQIEQTKDRIGALKGEWALLNEPERLQDLAQQHLALKTLAPTQFVALADLGNHLPAPLPPGTITMPADDAAQPTAPTPVAAVPVAAAKPAAAPTRVFAANDKAPDRAAEKTVDKSADKVTDRTGERPSDKLADKTSDKPAEKLAGPAAGHPISRPATMVAAAQHPLPPPIPVAQPPAPHIMAPVMNVSAQEVTHALAPGTVGAAVARANHAGRTATPTVMPASSMGQQAYVQPSYAQPFYAQSSYTQPSYAQPSYAAPSYGSAPVGASVSALGSAGRVALPAPVPYGAAR